MNETAPIPQCCHHCGRPVQYEYIWVGNALYHKRCAEPAPLVPKAPVEIEWSSILTEADIRRIVDDQLRQRGVIK